MDDHVRGLFQHLLCFRRDFHAPRGICSADLVAEVAPNVGRVHINGADNFYRLLFPHQPGDGCADGADTILDGANFLFHFALRSPLHARRTRMQRRAESEVKKKIRAIQYGVGPIGASIARLMREKQAIEIIGAIDMDPANVGRYLGDEVGAADAPWGVKVSAEAKEVLEQAADVVIHSTSSSLAKVMDQLLMCLEAESCIVSTCEELSYPFRTHPELAAKLDTAAKEWGVALVGTGVNPGFVMDKLVVTLAAVAQRIEHAKG